MKAGVDVPELDLFDPFDESFPPLFGLLAQVFSL